MYENITFEQYIDLAPAERTKVKKDKLHELLNQQVARRNLPHDGDLKTLISSTCIFVPAVLEFSINICHIMPIRPREIFWIFKVLGLSKNLGQNLGVVAISGHFERFSPGLNGSKVGCPGRQ